MSSRKNKSNKNNDESDLRSQFGEHTIRSVLGIISFAVAVFLIMARFSKAGFVGDMVFKAFDKLLGVGYFLLPLFTIILAIIFLRNLRSTFHYSRVIASSLSLISGLGLIELLFRTRGGILGKLIISPFINFFDYYVGVIFMITLFLISVLLTFNIGLNFDYLFFWRKFKKTGKEDIDNLNLIVEDNDQQIPQEVKEEISSNQAEKLTEENLENESGMEGRLKNEGVMAKKSINKWQDKEYKPFPLSLLERDSGKPGVGDIKANANIIKRSLQNFGINVEMDEVSIGPSVTRYALKPAEGVKLSRIVGLQNDLALALAAHPIRIEAPIPGKSLVGIEIPNSTKTTVGLGTLFSSLEFQNSEKPLLMALGKGVAGKSHFANLGKMPHLLIAGATGSGKSVMIHSVITSLLYKNSPYNLKFIMVDPKRVELTLYNKIPHLLSPVITDSKKTILALKWAANEMDRRYDILEAESVRDVESYHKNILIPELEKVKRKKSASLEEIKIPELMPYIVIVIDELADIMQAFPRELESAIVRLAQMSRAVGIHLILSTQRPSVNIITGLIKANIPSRIAMQVISQIDSRTILDMGGAEKLLGAGDMLFLSGEMSKPQRIQSAFISEDEVKKVVKYLSQNHEEEIPEEISLTPENNKNHIFDSAVLDRETLEDDDELYEEARIIVLEAGKASTSYIQRKLRVGYARAARLMDMLEERGIIGPSDGSKPRSVIDGVNISRENEPLN